MVVTNSDQGIVNSVFSYKFFSLADVFFNRDDLFAVATGSLPKRGEMIMEGKCKL